ncbi:hypothetical protein AGMMS49938_13610 [Fibrobacterales bacterium]|nr:hypothetical protein AGMMS49938_13610 [Fibrobacterales bacterium]
MSGEVCYSVILEKLTSQTDLRGVVGAISNILGVAKKDAVEKAKKLPLVLVENLPEKEARLMVDMLGSMGAEVRVTPPFGVLPLSDYEENLERRLKERSLKPQKVKQKNGIHIGCLATMVLLLIGFAAFASLRYEWIIAQFKPSPEKSDKLIQKGKMSEARKSINSQLKEKPDDTELWLLQGKLYIGIARKKMDSEQWKSYGERGALPELDSAIVFFRKAESLDPKESETLRWISIAEQMQLDLSDAEIAARRAVNLDPANPDNWNQLGSVLTDDGQISQAEQAFYNALKSDPNNAPALKNLAILNLYYTKDGERAAGFLFSFLNTKDGESDVDSYQLRVDLASAMIGDFNPPWGKLTPPPLPFEEYEKRRIAISQNPNLKDDPLLQEELGILYLSRNENQAAEDCFVKAIQLNSSVESSRKMLGIMYMKSANYEAALKIMQIAADNGSKDPFFWKNIGVLQKYYKANAQESAKAFNKYFALGGDQYANRIRR